MKLTLLELWWTFLNLMVQGLNNSPQKNLQKTDKFLALVWNEGIWCELTLIGMALFPIRIHETVCVKMVGPCDLSFKRWISVCFWVIELQSMSTKSIRSLVRNSMPLNSDTKLSFGLLASEMAYAWIISNNFNCIDAELAVKMDCAHFFLPTEKNNSEINENIASILCK